MSQAVQPQWSIMQISARRWATNLALLVGGVAGGAWLLFSPSVPEPAESAPAESAKATASVVELSPNKFSVAAIETQPVSRQRLAHRHTVPGRIEYDATRKLQLRLPAEGVVKSVLVRPGQKVGEGTQLMVLTSQPVGVARDQMRQREEDLAMAKYQLKWTNDIAANVTDLLSSLKQSPKMNELEAVFADRPLGEHRRELIGAYSDYLLARQIQTQSSTLTDTGVLSGRTLQERRNKLERAQSSFQSVCEEATHHVRVEQRTAETAVARAERALKISGEQLAALLGPYTSAPKAVEQSMNEFVLNAPFAGRIQEVHVRPAAVVASNHPLVTLANTDYLWVSAQIHERNWSAAALGPGQTLRVRTPATGDQEFDATIEFVGAAVDPRTRALPLVAKIENRKQQLKPGMFVWVSVPIEPEAELLVVPNGAVMRHEDQAFVFVALGERQFRRVDITTGLETEDWIEVVSGLTGREMVASTGAFILKSELLLEKEG